MCVRVCARARVCALQSIHSMASFQARKELDVQAIFEAALRRRKRIEDSESEEDDGEDGWSSDED